MFSYSKNQTVQTIGICESDNYFCFVTLDNAPKVDWLVKQDMTQSLTDYLQTRFNRSTLRLIYAVPHRFIWRKYLFFPIHYSSKILYQQIIRHLNQALPIDLEQVYFDYQLTAFPESEAVRVIIYAIKKEYVDELTQTSEMILDCELFCFIRGIHYLKNTPLEHNLDHYYQFEDNYIQFKYDELIIRHQKPDNMLYYSVEQTPFSADIIEPAVYLKALGACLWSGRE